MQACNSAMISRKASSRCSAVAMSSLSRCLAVALNDLIIFSMLCLTADVSSVGGVSDARFDESSGGETSSWADGTADGKAIALNDTPVFKLLVHKSL